jgi:hypothetical protein
VLDEERKLGPPGWRGLGVGLTFSPFNYQVVSKPWQQGGHVPKINLSTM